MNALYINSLKGQTVIIQKKSLLYFSLIFTWSLWPCNVPKRSKNIPQFQWLHENAADLPPFVWPFHKVTAQHVAHINRPLVIFILIHSYSNMISWKPDAQEGSTHPFPYTKNGRGRERKREKEAGREPRPGSMCSHACSTWAFAQQNMGVTRVLVCPYVQKELSMSSAVEILPVHNPKLTVASSAS